MRSSREEQQQRKQQAEQEQLLEIFQQLNQLGKDCLLATGKALLQQESFRKEQVYTLEGMTHIR